MSRVAHIYVTAIIYCNRKRLVLQRFKIGVSYGDICVKEFGPNLGNYLPNISV